MSQKYQIIRGPTRELLASLLFDPAVSRATQQNLFVLEVGPDGEKEFACHGKVLVVRPVQPKGGLVEIGGSFEMENRRIGLVFSARYDLNTGTGIIRVAASSGPVGML